MSTGHFITTTFGFFTKWHRVGITTAHDGTCRVFMLHLGWFSLSVVYA